MTQMTQIQNQKPLRGAELPARAGTNERGKRICGYLRNLRPYLEELDLRHLRHLRLYLEEFDLRNLCHLWPLICVICG